MKKEDDPFLSQMATWFPAFLLWAKLALATVRHKSARTHSCVKANARLITQRLQRRVGRGQARAQVAEPVQTRLRAGSAHCSVRCDTDALFRAFHRGDVCVCSGKVQFELALAEAYAGAGTDARMLDRAQKLYEEIGAASNPLKYARIAAKQVSPLFLCDRFG